jgi:hypothetical protein
MKYIDASIPFLDSALSGNFPMPPRRICHLGEEFCILSMKGRDRPKAKPCLGPESNHPLNSMPETTLHELGAMIRSAFHLPSKPLAAYGSDEPPEGGVLLSTVHRCIATTMVRMATGHAPAIVFLGTDAKSGCCPGGLSHTGYIMRPPAISYFVSTGRPGIPDAPAEFLKASPDLVDQCFAAVGTITPPGKYLVIRTCESVPDSISRVLAVTCFGTGEQIRNLAALVHFDRPEPFFPVLVPWGPACATLVTYPGGLAANAPTESAFLGPQDPTMNYALPPDLLGIGLPFDVARKVGENIGRSFIARRPEVAFPDHGD